MKGIFLSLLACSLFTTGCGNNISTDTHNAHVATLPKGISKFDSAHGAYEAGNFHSMLELISTEEDTYGINKHFVPAIGRDKIEYSQGKWKHQKLCPKQTNIKPNAIEKVVLEALDSRLIIINEAHDSPQHREFILQLLPHLADQGFNVYAAETFSLGDMNIEQWNEAISLQGAMGAKGFYSKEPTFSRLISKAHELNFQLIPYEYLSPKGSVENNLSVGERIRIREEGQAKNLWDRALKDNRNKVVLHVGYAHVKEEVDEFGNFWLASVLKNSYGINPLTISQINCTTDSQDKGWMYSSTSNKDGVDINVHSMEEVLRNKRPVWLDLFSYRRISTNEFVKDNFESVIIEATSLKDNRIADRIFFKNGEKIELILQPGSYKFISTYSNGEVGKFPTRTIK